MTQQKEAEKTVVQAHDKPLVFSLPELDETIRELAAGTADPRGAGLVAAATLADTNGWDTAFAIRPSDVNDAIQKQGTSPQSFSQDLGGGWTTEGTFGTWQLAPGGSGALVRMALPIQTGYMTFQGQRYPMDGATATIEVSFAYSPPVPPTPVEPTDDGTRHDLKVSTTPDAKTKKAVSVTSFDPPQTDPPPPSYVVPLMGSALEQWLNDNIAAFGQVFASVDLNVKAANGGLQWLKPTYTSYAYADVGGDLGQSIFGVLCTTGGNDPSKLTNEISAAAIPDGGKAGFLIGKQLFMRESVLPSLPSAFDGSNASSADFQLINDDTEAVMNDGVELELDGVKYGAITYHPYLTSFDLMLDAAEIVTTTTVKVQISPGIVAYVYTTTYYTMTLETKSDGSQTIGYVQTRDPVSNHEVKTSPGVIVTEDLANLIAGIVGIISGNVLKEVVERVIIGIILLVISGIIWGIDLIITDVIAKGVIAAMPSISPLVLEATGTVAWPAQESRFTLQNVALNGAVQLSGDPGFAS